MKLLSHPEFISGNINTVFLDDNLAELIPDESSSTGEANTSQPLKTDEGFAGANLKTKDPLALFDYDQQVKSTQQESETELTAPQGPDGTVNVVAPIQGTVISIDVDLGQEVTKGQQLLGMEAM